MPPLSVLQNKVDSITTAASMDPKTSNSYFFCKMKSSDYLAQKSLKHPFKEM